MCVCVCVCESLLCVQVTHGSVVLDPFVGTGMLYTLQTEPCCVYAALLELSSFSFIF